jgi:hypothetical protein
MEWHSNDQPQQDDRRGDLNPDHSVQLSQHDLAARPRALARFIDEGGEDQRPSRKHRQKAKRLRFGQLADGGAG